MPVTESERLRLFDSLTTHLGAAPAETLMNLMLPSDSADLATKADVGAVRGEMAAEFAAVRGEMAAEFAAVRGEMAAEFAAVRGEIAEVRDELKSEIAELKTEIAAVRADLTTQIAELKTQVAEVRADLGRTFGMWLFASQAGVIAAVAVIVGLAS